MMNILKGKWVFDTNLFIYFLNESSPFYDRARQLFAKITSEKINPYLGQQNIIEAERILIQRYKRTVKEATYAIKSIVNDFSFKILTPLPGTINTFHSLLTNLSSGSDIFDYYLAATMLDNGFKRILTANIQDFSKIPGIEAVNPFK